MATGNSGVHRMDATAGHLLRGLDRALDRLHGGFDINHHAFFQSARRMGADTDHFDTLRAHLANNGHHF